MKEEKLLEQASKAKENAYAPYSKFQVGAALLTTDGEVFIGCNIENSSYGATICAERSAVFNAVSHGKKEFKAIAIASSGDDTVYPCGMCRQVLHEFNPKITVICGNKSGYETYTLEELMPKGF